VSIIFTVPLVASDARRPNEQATTGTAADPLGTGWSGTVELKEVKGPQGSRLIPFSLFVRLLCTHAGSALQNTTQYVAGCAK
jgi:hypothetical protein